MHAETWVSRYPNLRSTNSRAQSWERVAIGQASLSKRLPAWWDQSWGRSFPVGLPVPTFDRHCGRSIRDFAGSEFHHCGRSARHRLACAKHHATRDRTRLYKNLGTSWTGPHCQTNSFSCPAERELDRRIWFPVKDKRPKPLCHRDGSHEPAQWFSECPASSRLDIRIAKSSKPGSPPSAGSHDRPRSGRHVSPYPWPIEFFGIPTLLPSIPQRSLPSAVHEPLLVSSNRHAIAS